MPTNKPWIKIVIIVLITLMLFGVYTCKSKAEEAPEHHYNSDFDTPDPNGDIYDWLETQEPYYPYFTFEPMPLPTDTPIEIMGAPASGTQLLYDPFLVYPAGSFLRWKRLNGSQATYQPPVPSSALHRVSPASSSYTSGDESVYSYNYAINPDGVNETSTKFAGPYGAQLVYVLMQDFATNQNARQISVGDVVHIDFQPGIAFYSEDAEYNNSSEE